MAEPLAERRLDAADTESSTAHSFDGEPVQSAARMPAGADSVLAYLDADLLKMEDWPYPEPASIPAQLLNNLSGHLWVSIPGGHKWLNYFDAYEVLFSRWRNASPKVLEIGVDRGGSLRLWKSYFGEGSSVVGVDINPQCARFDNPAINVHVRIGSQADPIFLRRIVAEFGRFDIIIDDGSHMVSHQIASFNALFDTGLCPGGIYMVEDLESSYWGKRSGQLDLPISFIDFARAAVDLIHQPYVDHDYAAFRIEQIHETKLRVPRLTKILDQVRFFDSIVAFYRCDRIPPVTAYLP